MCSLSHFHFAAFAAESPNSFVFGRGSCELIRLEVANHLAPPASIFFPFLPLWHRGTVVFVCLGSGPGLLLFCCFRA